MRRDATQSRGRHEGEPEPRAALRLADARRAADLGDAYAMNTVGALYANGQGVPADHAEGVRWYERAAAANNDVSKANLRNLASAGFAPATAALRRLGLE